MLSRISKEIACHANLLPSLTEIVMSYLLSKPKIRKPKYIGAYGTLAENLAITNLWDQSKALYGAALYGRWDICEQLVAFGANPGDEMLGTYRRGDVAHYKRLKKTTDYRPSNHADLITIGRGGSIDFLQQFVESESKDVTSFFWLFVDCAVCTANVKLIKYLGTLDPVLFSHYSSLNYQASEVYKLFRHGSLNAIQKISNLLHLNEHTFGIPEFQLMIHQAARGGSVSVFEYVLYWARSKHNNFLSSTKHQSVLLKHLCESGKMEVLHAFERYLSSLQPCVALHDVVAISETPTILAACMSSGDVAMMTWGLDQLDSAIPSLFSCDFGYKLVRPIKYAVKSLSLPVCVRLFAMIRQRFSLAGVFLDEIWSDVSTAMLFLLAACEIGATSFFEALRNALAPNETAWEGKKTRFMQAALDNGQTSIAEHLLKTQYDDWFPLDALDNICHRPHPSIGRFALTYAIRIQTRDEQFKLFQDACLSVVRKAYDEANKILRLDIINYLLCIVCLDTRQARNLTFLHPRVVLHSVECLFTQSQLHTCTCKSIYAGQQKRIRKTVPALRRSKRLKTSDK